MSKETITIPDSLLNKSLQVSPEVRDFNEMETFTEDDFFNTSFIAQDNEVKNQVRQLQTLITSVASGKTNDYITLFELSYSYGMQGYDVSSIERILGPVISIYRRNLLPQEEVSQEGNTYLPEDPTLLLVTNYQENKARLAKEIYLSGLAAGVLAITPQIQEALFGYSEEQAKPVEARFADFPEGKRVLLDQLSQDPTALIDALLPEVEKIVSLEELEQVEVSTNQLLGGYLDSRVKKIINAKRQSRKSLVSSPPTNSTAKQKEPRLFSVWSVDFEDKYSAQARFLLSEKSDPKELDKKEIYSLASRLSSLGLTRELLMRDIPKGIIPQEVSILIDTYLFEQTDTLRQEIGNERSFYNEFVTFVLDQFSCEQIGSKIENYMEKTTYWEESGKRQIITPDTLQLTENQLDQIRTINYSFGCYLTAVREMYADALYASLLSSKAKQLLDKLEGGLPLELTPFCRQLMLQPTKIDSLRFDLIPDQDGTLKVGEVQIISGGTPPAVLYRDAFEASGKELIPVGEGILPSFIKRVRKTSSDPFTITLYSDRPYSSEIAQTTSWAGNTSLVEKLNENGVKAEAAFPQDIIRADDGRLYIRQGDFEGVPVTTIYNRVDYVSPKAVTILSDPRMQDILKAAKDRDVDMFPTALPILFGKGIYALIWDDNFKSDLIKKVGYETYMKLRRFTPPTYWVSPDTNSVDLTTIDPTQWIRKGSYDHATMNMVMGIDSPEEFRRVIKEDLEKPYSAIIQQYVDSLQPKFRVKRKVISSDGTAMNLWVKTPFRLRIEPTSIDGNVCEVFVTGSPERIVHGRSTSIMTIAEGEVNND